MRKVICSLPTPFTDRRRGRLVAWIASKRWAAPSGQGSGELFHRLMASPARWEADPTTGFLLSWSFDQMLNCFKYGMNLLTLFILPPFELVQPVGQFLVRGEQLPKPHKRP